MATQFHKWLKEKELLPGGYTITSQDALVSDLSRRDFGLKLLLVAEKELDLIPLLQRSGFELCNTDYRATLGFNLSFRDYETSDYRIRVMAWNVLPPHIYYFLSHYGGAHGTLLIFDIYKTQNLDRISSLHDLVKDINGDIPIALVGHKPNLSGKRKFTQKAAQYIAEQLEIPYHETQDPRGPTLDPVLIELLP